MCDHLFNHCRHKPARYTIRHKTERFLLDCASDLKKLIKSSTGSIRTIYNFYEFRQNVKRQIFTLDDSKKLPHLTAYKTHSNFSRSDSGKKFFVY